MPRFELIGVAPDVVFDLSLSVDTHRQSMGRSNERAVAGVTSGSLKLNDSVTWQARHFGLPFRMTSTITAWDKPTRFVDEQTHGPFRSWRHEHRFEAVDDGTRMLDNISYASPFGLLGRLVDFVVLASYMRRLIEQRNAWLKQSLA